MPDLTEYLDAQYNMIRNKVWVLGVRSLTQAEADFLVDEIDRLKQIEQKHRRMVSGRKAKVLTLAEKKSRLHD